MSEIIIITNYGPGDQLFDSDRGSWNVTRAQEDCRAGKHAVFSFDIAETVHTSRLITVDENKIADMVAHPETVMNAMPLIFVEDGKNDDGRPMIWLIDGHHRVRALQRLGFTDCLAFVIEREHTEQYRVLFNGERVAPWMEDNA